MGDEIQIAANKIAGFIYKMYLKDLKAGNIVPKIPKKKLKGGKDALFDYTG